MARRIDGAVGRAVAGEEKVAVAFSGGLDSSLLALCASRRVSAVACTGYAPGGGDGPKARRAASELGVEFAAVELTPASVARELPLPAFPFTPTLMDRSLWCLFSAVSRTAHASGAGVMLLGQLSDELFGGYAKYAEALRSRGGPAARELMDADVRRYATRGRLRDVASCSRWVEPRLPFEEAEVAKYAGALPVEYKIRGEERKSVLREAARILGLPSEIAEAPKKAAQYSSGVQKLVAGARF